MPKLTYKAEENKRFELVPRGDYLLTVVSSRAGYSQASNTRDAEQIEMTLEVRESESGPVLGRFNEWLTFHEKVLWKVDTFVTCVGYTVTKGQEVEITVENVIGLRGWGHVDTYTTATGKTFNQVKLWYTDKPKFAPVALAAQAAEDDIPF